LEAFLEYQQTLYHKDILGLHVDWKVGSFKHQRSILTSNLAPASSISFKVAQGRSRSYDIHGHGDLAAT
jgi:hypothetical protein